jgi:plastocyanin
VRPLKAITSRLVIAALGMLLAGCGGGSSAAKSGGGSSHSASGGSSGGVKISNFKFSPATITVKQGARLSVTNDDSTAHTATADDGQSFDTGTVDPGASKTISVSKPGSYPYHCSIHPSMHGKLIVK